MMFIHHLLGSARQRLAVVSGDAPICNAAAILASPNIPLVVVCDSHGAAIGVISRTNVLVRISEFGPAGLDAAAEAIMTRSFHACHEHQPLQSAWETMVACRVRCLPVLDESRRPLGVVHARDVASALLSEVASEELLLRDYVLGIGYQ